MMTKSETVYDIILQQIKTDKLMPGQLVNENKISKELKINRSAVREAISHLVAEGFIEKNENNRKYVSTIKINEEKDLNEFRAIIEAGSASLITNRIDQNALEELKKLINEHYYFLERKYWDVTDEIERRFHKLIVEQSGNKYLIKAYSHSKIALHIKIKEHDKTKEYQMKIIREHEEIVRAIESKDEKKAFFAVWKHLTK